MQMNVKISRKPRFLMFALAFLVAACGEDDATEAAKPTKLADIYFRYAVEHAVGGTGRYGSIMTDAVIAEGARCVQDMIVSKRQGLYSRARLQSLLLKNLFPNDLGSYRSFLSEERVQKSAKERVGKLGFKSLGEAARSTNLIAKALVNEYAFYAQFNRMHQVRSGVQPSNLVMMKCAPDALKSMVP